MATNLELSQYLRLNNLPQTDYLIPYQESKVILKLSVKTYANLCRVNKVKHDLQYANLIPDAYGNMMFDYRFNYFKLFK